MDKAELNIKNLTVKFGGLTAVDAVTFTIQRGEIISLIGPNGAGKTTVFNAVTGIHSATSGSVCIGQNPLQRALSPQSIIGFAFIATTCGLFSMLTMNIVSLWENTISANYIYQQPFPWASAYHSFISYLTYETIYYTLLPFLAGGLLGLAAAISLWLRARSGPDIVVEFGLARTFQNIRLFGEMSVLENVTVGMERHLKNNLLDALIRLPRFLKEEQNSINKAHDILKFVELDGFAAQKASSLPYGYQRRLEIARALATEPEFLLLDEPAAGMNPVEAHELLNLIRIIRDRGITIMLIEHHMKVVMDVSDRIVVLDYGHKIAEGTPAEIRVNQKVIEAYLGQESSHA